MLLRQAKTKKCLTCSSDEQYRENESQLMIANLFFTMASFFAPKSFFFILSGARALSLSIFSAYCTYAAISLCQLYKSKTYRPYNDFVTAMEYSPIEYYTISFLLLDQELGFICRKIKYAFKFRLHKILKYVEYGGIIGITKQFKVKHL